jgi:hypothetical protein
MISKQFGEVEFNKIQIIILYFPSESIIFHCRKSDRLVNTLPLTVNPADIFVPQFPISKQRLFIGLLSEASILKVSVAFSTIKPYAL